MNPKQKETLDAIEYSLNKGDRPRAFRLFKELAEGFKQFGRGVQDWIEELKRKNRPLADDIEALVAENRAEGGRHGREGDGIAPDPGGGRSLLEGPEGESGPFQKEGDEAPQQSLMGENEVADRIRELGWESVSNFKWNHGLPPDESISDELIHDMSMNPDRFEAKGESSKNYKTDMPNLPGKERESLNDYSEEDFMGILAETGMSLEEFQKKHGLRVTGTLNTGTKWAILDNRKSLLD